MDTTRMSVEVTAILELACPNLNINSRADTSREATSSQAATILATELRRLKPMEDLDSTVEEGTISLPPLRSQSRINPTSSTLRSPRLSSIRPRLRCTTHRR